MDTRLRQYNQEQKLIEWAKQITERQESGMPIEKWCRERGISKQTYYRWPLSIDDVTAMIAGQIGQLAPMDEETADLFQRLVKKMIEQAEK